MQPTPVIPIHYRQDADIFWPRIHRVIALITTVFAALTCGIKLISAWTIWNLPPGVFADREHLVWRASLVFEIALSLLLICGALLLLIRTGAYRMLVVASWCWIAGTLLVSAAGPIAVRYRPAQIAMTLLNDAAGCALPALIIALFWLYRKDQRRVPAAEVSPAAHDAQAPTATLG
jgi:hypothetical protein